MDRINEQALRHLEKALACEPDHMPSLIALSNAYLKQKEFAKVAGLVEKALAFGQGQGGVHEIKARLLRLQGDFEGASASIGSAIELEPDKPSYFKLASEIAKSRQNVQELQFFLERLIDLDPLDGESHLDLARLLRHPDDFARVKLLLEISVDLLPGDTRPLFDLARHLYAGESSLPDGTLKAQPAPDAAEALLRKMLEIDENHSEAKMLLAEIKLEDESDKDALLLLQEAYEDRKTKGDAAIQLGIIWSQKGNAEKAMGYFKQAIKFEGSKAMGEFRLGLLYFRQGKSKDAEHYFRKAIPSLKDEEKRIEKAKEIHLEKLDFHGSRKQLQTLQEVRRRSGEASLGIYKCNYQNRHQAEASKFLDQALRLYPHFPEANYEKGLLHLESKELDYAIDRFIKSVESDWNYWPSHMELAKAAKSKKEFEKAEMHLKIVLDLDPGNKNAPKLLKQMARKDRDPAGSGPA